MAPSSFSDARVWVTGGQRGIGLALARAFAQAGSELVITSRTPDAPTVRESLATLERDAQAFAQRSGMPARAVRCLAWDMADDVSSEALARELKAAPPHILVHSAHVFAEHTPVVALKPADFSRSLALNVGGAYAICRMAARHMARAGFGRILLIGSLASQIGGKGQVSYITEKAALDGLTRALAVELGQKGVLVNIIHPGIVDTENVRGRLSEALLRAYAQRTATGRLLSAEEVALSALSLCDPRSAAITGQSIRLGAGVDSALALLGGHGSSEDEGPR